MKHNSEKEKKPGDDDRIVINTGSSKYSFSQSWLENDGLKSVLVGLVSDDLNRHLGDDDGPQGQ